MPPDGEKSWFGLAESLPTLDLAVLSGSGV